MNDTLERINTHLNRLGIIGGFWLDERRLTFNGKPLLLCPKKFANAYMFINLGKLQAKVRNIGFFQHGWDGFAGLSFCLRSEITLKGLEEALSNIDEL
jgi:hypothetical protein